MLRRGKRDADLRSPISSSECGSVLRCFRSLIDILGRKIDEFLRRLRRADPGYRYARLRSERTSRRDDQDKDGQHCPSQTPYRKSLYRVTKSIAHWIPSFKDAASRCHAALSVRQPT